MKKKIVAFVADATLIVVFAAAGRTSHNEGLAGTFMTALPFFLALVIAWLIPTVRSQPLKLIPAGILVWLISVFCGQGIRLLMGGTSALSFLLVTLIVLAFFLLGWRAIVKLIAGKRKTRVAIK